MLVLVWGGGGQADWGVRWAEVVGRGDVGLEFGHGVTRQRAGGERTEHVI